MYLSGEFESLQESIKWAKMTPFITWMSVRGETFLILLGPYKWVLVNGIESKRYQMKDKERSVLSCDVKISQKCQIYYKSNGYEKCSTTYSCTKVDL